jgi:hypothetical protein
MQQTGESDRRARTLFWVLLGLLTLGRLSLIGRFEFSTDEAHYVMYGRHPAWGYFDHPPLVGFLAAAGHWLGSSEFVMRLGPVLLGSLSLAFMGLLARDLYGWRAALLGLALAACVPILMLLGLALLPDAPLNVFWCGALWAAWRATQRGGWGWWLLTGLLIGGAMLSKYHGVLLPAFLGLYLLTSSAGRRWFARPQPYAAGVLALLVFLPNILWNAGHDWVSYAYQLGHGGGDGRLTPWNVFASIGGQLAAGTPILFVLVVVAAVALIRRPRQEADRYVFWTSLPVFVFFCGIGLFGKVLPHWPAPGWWTGLIALAAILCRRLPEGGPGARRWRRWTLAGVFLGLFAVVLLPVLLLAPVISWSYLRLQPLSESWHARWPAIKPLKPFTPKVDLANDVVGWRVLAGEVEALRRSMPEPERTFVMAGRFFALSQTAAYLDPAIPVWATRPPVNQYTFWFDPTAHAGWDAIIIEDSRDSRPGRGREDFLALFRAIDPEPRLVRVERAGIPARQARLWIARGFKGKGPAGP